jgi:hypothetical protein
LLAGSGWSLSRRPVSTVVSRAWSSAPGSCPGWLVRYAVMAGGMACPGTELSAGGWDPRAPGHPGCRSERGSGADFCWGGLGLLADREGRKGNFGSPLGEAKLPLRPHEPEPQEPEPRKPEAGTRRAALARHARNKRLADAIYPWAFAALITSPGARTFHDQRRADGDTHHQALRPLGNHPAGISPGGLTHPTPAMTTTPPGPTAPISRRRIRINRPRDL